MTPDSSSTPPDLQPPPLPPNLPSGSSAPQMGDDFGMRLLLPVGRSGWAIAAGYLGLFCIIILPAPLALVVSIVAILDIRKSRFSQHPKHGMGRAIFGLIMGLLGTPLCVMLVTSMVTVNHR